MPDWIHTSEALNPKRFFGELKRRKVYRVAIGYAVVGWLLIQIATQTFPFFEIPNWAVRLVIALLVLGFPVALVLAWAFDLTAAGIKRTDERKSSDKAAISPSVPDKSIAVLPFENLSDDQENTYLADGIQDDILSSLAKVSDLKVISRTSVRQYRGGVRNLREIGAALGVAHILEGTVRRAGQRVRVNAQLINAHTDAHVWSDSFDREMTDLFALQSELAEQIATALRAKISPSEKARLQMHPTSDLKAYDLYLRARDLFRWSGAGDPRENGEKALRLLEQALARDGNFALAHALASRFHSELFWFGHDKTRARLESAEATAQAALRIQPDLSEGRVALAYVFYYGDRDYKRARREIEIALRDTPNDSEIWDCAAALDRREGRWNKALTNFIKARQLDPRSPSAIWNVAETHACLGRYREAEDGFAEGFALNPQAHLFSLARAAISLKAAGDVAPLREALRELPAEFDPGGEVTTVALRVRLMERNFDEAKRLLQASAADRFNDGGIGGVAAALDGYTFPRAWYEGLVARGEGKADESHKAFETARRIVAAELAYLPDDAKTSMLLGLIDAALGRKEEAIREGRRAIELLPIARDAYDGPVFATNLAVIYAWLGEHDLAIEQLKSLADVPNGPTPGTLRAEPEWDNLRADPRFEKLAGRGD